MFTKISNSWNLAKFSFTVLKSDFSLMVIPFISGIIMLIITLLMIIPVSAFVETDIDGEYQVSPAGLFIIYIFGIISYTVAIYFNVALTAILFKKFEGVHMSISDGLAEANKRLGNIVKYSFIATTIGLIISFIGKFLGNSSNKGVNIFGQIFTGVFEIGWSLITFFIVPVLVMQNLSPVDSIKESGRLMKSTWGEQIVGTFSFQLIISLFALPAFVISILLIISGLDSNKGLLILGFVFFMLTVIAVSLISSTINSIFRAVLYKYAGEGKAVAGFSTETLQHAFQTKHTSTI